MKRVEIYFDSYFMDKIKEEMREYGIEQYAIVPQIYSRWSRTLKILIIMFGLELTVF